MNSYLAGVAAGAVLSIFVFIGVQAVNAQTDPAAQLTGTEVKIASGMYLRTFPNGLRCVTYHTQGIDCDWKNATR